MHILLYSLVILCEHIFGASYSLKCMKYLSQYQSKPIPDKVQRNIFKVVRINSRRESEQSQEAWGNGNSTFRQLKMWGFSQMNQLEPDTTSFLSTSEVTPKDTLRNGSHNQLYFTDQSGSQEEMEKKFRVHFILLCILHYTQTHRQQSSKRPHYKYLLFAALHLLSKTS